MRTIVFSLLSILCSIGAQAQFSSESEAFKVNDQFVIRDGENFTWQKGNQLLHLGSLKKIPSYRNLESYDDRGALFNSLLSQFLDGVIKEAQQQNRDSIFINGFGINDSELKALGVKYKEGDPFAVYVGLKEYKEEVDKVAPESFSKLFQNIAEKLNENSTAKYSVATYKKSGKRWSNCHHILRDGKDIFRLHQHIRTSQSTDNVNEVLQIIGASSYGSFISRLLTKPTEFKYSKNNSHDLNVNTSLTEKELQIIQDAFLGKDIQKKLVQKQIEVRDLEIAQQRGNYGFIVDYLKRSVKFPDTIGRPIRQILYTKNPSDPIFIQDSVLDYYESGRFHRVMDQRIQKKHKDTILEELLHRINAQKSTKIEGKVEEINNVGLRFSFEGEDFDVIARKRTGKDVLDFYYIVGWENIDNPENFIKRLEKAEVEKRERIQIEIINDQLLMMYPQQFNYSVFLWNEATKEKNEITSVSLNLSQQQQDLALLAVLDKFQNIEREFHTVTTANNLSSNELILFFQNEQKRLHLYTYRENKSPKHVVLLGKQYNEKHQPTYDILLKTDDLEGEFSMWTVGDQSFLVDKTNQVWSIKDNKLQPLLQLDRKRELNSIGEKLITLIQDQENQSYEVVYWNENDEYVVISDQDNGSLKIVSERPNLSSIIEVQGYAPFANKEQITFTQDILEILESNANSSTGEILGEPSNNAWLFTTGNNVYLAGNDLKSLQNLGNQYDVTIGADPVLLNHLQNWISKTKINPEISLLQKRSDGWLYGVESQPFTVHVFRPNNDLKNQRLEGTILQKDYQNKPFTNALLSSLNTMEVIHTNVINEVQISTSGNQLMIWNPNENTPHFPAPQFPNLKGANQRQLLGLLSSFFTKNTSFKVIPEGILDNSTIYSLYSEQDATWYLIPKEENQVTKIRNLDRTLGSMFAKEVLQHKGVYDYEYSENSNVHFLQTQDNELIRVVMNNNIPKWTSMGRTDGIQKEQQETLYRKLLNVLAINQSIDTLKGFRFQELDVHKVLLWKDINTKFRTIIQPKIANANALDFLQDKHELLSNNKQVLDHYFSQIYAGVSSNSIKVFNIGNEFTSFYNESDGSWHFNRGGGPVKTTKITNATFERLNTIGSDNHKMLLADILYKHHTNQPNLKYAARGFYYFPNNNEVIFYIRGKYGNKVRKTRISKIKDYLTNSIGVNAKIEQRLNTSSYYRITNRVLKIMIVDGILEFHSQLNLNQVFPFPPPGQKLN